MLEGALCWNCFLKSAESILGESASAWISVVSKREDIRALFSGFENLEEDLAVAIVVLKLQWLCDAMVHGGGQLPGVREQVFRRDFRVEVHVEMVSLGHSLDDREEFALLNASSIVQESAANIVALLGRDGFAG